MTFLRSVSLAWSESWSAIFAVASAMIHDLRHGVPCHEQDDE